MSPLLEWTVKASLLMAVALLTVACSRRRSAEFRHSVLAAAVVSALALPALMVVSPGWQIPGATVTIDTPLAFTDGSAPPAISPAF